MCLGIKISAVESTRSRLTVGVSNYKGKCHNIDATNI
jgi:hypothetical protein